MSTNKACTLTERFLACTQSEPNNLALLKQFGANLTSLLGNTRNNPGEVQITRPYLSNTGTNMCVTLSLTINTGQSKQLLCCDLDWNEKIL